MLNWFGRRAPKKIEPPKVYIYHLDHEHDRTYTENVVEYLEQRNVLWRSITLAVSGPRPELQLCLDDCPTAVLSYNSLLDHSWLPSGSFLEAAKRHGVPVLQWIVDHPSSRWAEFNTSTAQNSCFLLNSPQEQKYFETYCLPGSLTATMGGVGPNCRSRIGTLTRDAFMRRPIMCMIPLGLHRIRSIEENDAATGALERPYAEAVQDAIESARGDLVQSLQWHMAAALRARSKAVPPQTFNALCQSVEHSVQTWRRLKIFAVAQHYPILI